MAVPFGETAFSGGEITPSLFGRVDLDRFHIAAATLRNCYVGFKGGALSRAGTAYVGMSKQNPSAGQLPPRLVPFNFSLTQQYVVEFGDHYARFIFRGGYVVEGNVAVTGATNANPCVVNAPGHGYNAGDWIVFAGVFPQLNNQTVVVQTVIDANNFSIQKTDGSAFNSTAFPASSAGVAARIYEIASPYSGTDLAQLKWTQSADVLTLAHPNYPPQNLSRFGPLNWTIGPVPISTSISPPSSVSVVATTHPSPLFDPPTLPAAYAYVVTAVDPITGEESQPSPVGNVTDGVDMAATNGSNVITWSPVAGAASYRIYRAPTSYNTSGNATNALPVPVGALFGLVATAFGTQYVDNNDTADFSISPPLHQDPLAPGQILAINVLGSTGDWTFANVSMNTSTGSGFQGQAVIVGNAIVAVVVVNPGKGYLVGDTPQFSGDGSGASAVADIGPPSGTYPGVVSYFQQRRVYANSLNNPNTYWMSQPGAFNNFDTAIPVADADAITGTPFSEQVNGIQFIIEMAQGMMTFTGSAIEQVQAAGSSAFAPAAITPSNQQALPQSSIGSSATLAPVRDNWDLLYFEPDNATLRDLAYQLYFNLYTGIDVTWQSSHLVFGHQIVDRAWCRKPSYLLWLARDDGLLLSFTFMKEQQVSGWAKHTTQGQVRTLCSITELPVDALYMCVQRPVAGQSRYFIERMDDRIWSSVEDPWCVDCGRSTSLSQPNATLFAFSASGEVSFFATGAVFSGGNVGNTIRMGGGVALVTGFVDSQRLTGRWCYPCQEIIPDDPDQTPLAQTAGNWSIAGQTGSVWMPYQMAGKQVVGLADGVPIGPLTIGADGLVSLPFAASDVKIGLAFTAQVQSVYLDPGSNPTVQGRRKTVNAVTVRCEASAPMQAGANEIDTSFQSPPPLAVTWTTGMGGVAPSPQQLPPTYQSPTGQTVQPLFTGDIRINIPSNWKKPGQVAAQQTLPVPLQVLMFVPETVSGDIPEETYSPQSSRGSRQAA